MTTLSAQLPSSSYFAAAGPTRRVRHELCEHFGVHRENLFGIPPEPIREGVGVLPGMVKYRMLRVAFAVHLSYLSKRLQLRANDETWDGS